MDAIIGGLISLISVTGGIVLQHYLNLGRQKTETRQNATRVLYEKQIECYDKLLGTIPMVDEYITTLNVWLGESGEKAQANIKINSEKTNKFWPLKELMDAYYIYLPKRVIESINKLFFECALLSNNPTIEKTDNATKTLHLLGNALRTCVGIDTISDDLFEAFSNSKKASKQTTTS